MIDYDFERSVGFVLHETARMYGKLFGQRAKAHALGLTRAQCQVLVYLARHEGINQTGLAELLEIEPISLARLIDRMEQAGWVERRPDPGDRRARLLFLTAKAKPIFDEVVKVATEARSEALAGLSAADREHLLDLLLRIRANLSDRAAACAERLALLEGAK